MTRVSVVCYHYDEKAPVKSKKIEQEQKDLSRFDVYALGRTFNFRSEKSDSYNSEEWIKVIQKAAFFYNKNYDARFTYN